jgi:hypothetical protein
MAFVEIDCSDILRALRAGQTALERETGGAVDTLARAIADNAKRTHPYTDRTHDLTNSIDVLPGPGLLEAQVFADTPYAARLEGRPEYAYLAPAADAEATDARVEGIFVNACLAVQDVINRGGR